VTAYCQNDTSLEKLNQIPVRSNQMENLVRNLSLNAAKMDSRYLRLILVVLTLILFVIGAGAPLSGGGFGG
jgi:hypothetical protein